MKNNLFSLISSTLITALLALSGETYADDTEIYFARANVDNVENKPAANVLFLLDTSGSMSGTKMSNLKSAFRTVVSGLSDNVSVGVGRFNGNEGGYIFYPVTPMTDDEKVQVQKLVDLLPASGNTPTHESYTEMVRYMLGERPSNYAREGEATVNNPSTAVNLSVERKCIFPLGNWCLIWEDNITSTNFYESPTNPTNRCESNHIIVMTDGEPTQDADEDSRKYVMNKTGISCGTNSNANTSYNCQASLAKWLYNNGNDVVGANGSTRKSIKTWQVGFQMSESNHDNMDNVADLGGTDFARQAKTVDQLTAAFVDILDLIDGQSRSISAPGIAVNTMNRFQHLDELYYAVFQPAESSYWEGNLKSYRLKNQEVHGKDGKATDPLTGYFTPDSHSYWSAEKDGADATKGGARENVAERKLFYSIANGETRLLNWNSSWNQDPTNANLGLATDSNKRAVERTIMFDRLKTMWGDPMHSVPLMVNYGGDQNYVFVSTNGGMLHIIDTKDGSETASFMPHELFKEATSFTTNRPSLREDNTRQVYGLDASWVAWRKPGATLTAKPSKVYLYGGMRRGGESFYALDVTDPESPSLKWQIDRGDQGFGRLGQTWSTPTLMRFPTANGSVPALAFGAGYSPADHDNHQGRKTEDAMGNAAYIVNAENGQLLWTASHADMKWAIPGGVTVVDTNLDGVADLLYFADLGGQVFRTTLNQQGVAHTVQRIAELGGSGSSHRRFYEAPSVAYVKEGAENHLYVAVASGYRAHPLEESTNEGLFVVIDKDAMGSSISAVATLSNMANVVSNEIVDDDKPLGWYYLFEADSGRSGEKALASPTIHANTVMLSTYAPTVDQNYINPCAVRYGAAYMHTVDLRTGNPASIDREAPQPLSRSIKLKQSTPPPTPTMMIDEHGKLVTLVGTEVVGENNMTAPNLRKHRWMQLPKDEAGQILQLTNGGPNNEPGQD